MRMWVEVLSLLPQVQSEDASRQWYRGQGLTGIARLEVPEEDSVEWAPGDCGGGVRPRLGLGRHLA